MLVQSSRSCVSDVSALHLSVCVAVLAASSALKQKKRLLTKRAVKTNIAECRKKSQLAFRTELRGDPGR